MEPRWALGHPMLASDPLVFSMAVLWLREHNRVADLLARQHPAWDDQQLFDTARNIIIGTHKNSNPENKGGNKYVKKIKIEQTQNG